MSVRLIDEETSSVAVPSDEVRTGLTKLLKTYSYPKEIPLVGKDVLGKAYFLMSVFETVKDIVPKEDRDLVRNLLDVFTKKVLLDTGTKQEVLELDLNDLSKVVHAMVEYTGNIPPVVMKNWANHSIKCDCPKCCCTIPKYPGRYPKKCPLCGADLPYDMTNDVVEAYNRVVTEVKKRDALRKSIKSAIKKSNRNEAIKAFNSCLTRILIESDNGVDLFTRERDFLFDSMHKLFYEENIADTMKSLCEVFMDRQDVDKFYSEV